MASLTHCFSVLWYSDLLRFLCCDSFPLIRSDEVTARELKMQIPNTPLFVKTHDFNVWLLNHTMRFPKHFRYTLTQRLENLALEFEELLLMANALRGSERLRLLTQADGTLACLRVRLRYALDFQLLSGGQIKFATESLTELGALLGAWLKGMDR